MRLLCAVVAATFITCIVQPAGAQSLTDRLTPLIKAHQGDVAVAVKHLKSGESFAYQADEPMPTASLIKLPIMVEAYRQATEGRINLSDTVTFREEDKTPGSGILSTQFSPGASFSLRDAIRLMIAYSDNSATNLVLAKIGLPATNTTMEKLGFPNTKVHAFVFRASSSIAPQRSKQFGLGSTTASEMIRLVELIQARQLVSPQACDTMLDHLRQCDDKRLSRLLPATVKVAHKTGSVAAVRTDAGLIEARSGPIAVCVLTRNNKDQRWSDQNAGEVLTSRIAREAYDYFERDTGHSAAAPQELKLGATGELVQAVQRTLNARSTPSPELSIDGDFGPATEAAVKAFQGANQLTVTGIVSAETLKALGPLVAEDARQPPPPDVPSVAATSAPRDPLDAPPLTTCKAWAIVDAQAGKLLFGHNEAQKLDMASTTKMMTAYIVCQLAQDTPAILREMVTFSETADNTPGSTSAVKAGEKVAVGQLLFGLLLPSGNDAATAFAEHFGSRFHEPEPAVQTQDASGKPEAELTEQERRVRRFVAEMNRQAAKLGLTETHFENPHGLPAPGHQSSARDLAKLALAAMQNPHFRHCVGTRQHAGKVASESGDERELLWKNTNRLLGIEGYSGVKTGTTTAAGACLVAFGERDGRERIVVVLGSATSDARYVDSRNLFRWAWQQK